MRPNLVVDVGNSRVKIGRCQGGRVMEQVSASPDAPDEWHATVRNWFGDRQLHIAVAGVHPSRLTQFRNWAEDCGHFLHVIDSPSRLPLAVEVAELERVGIDRLLGVLAASRRVSPGESAVTVDVGTAVTINLLTVKGAFGGGCILPGPWLMARALHEHTAKLPLVVPVPGLPADALGRDTTTAIQAGIQSAVSGAVERTVGALATRCNGRMSVYVTGGGHAFLAGLTFAGVDARVEYDERLVLDGIRLAAEALP